MDDWVRFWITAAVLIGGLCCFVAEVIGAFRFKYVLNRIHAAGIGDTLGLMLIIASLCVAGGITLDTLKLCMIVAFMWFTSPVSTHFLSQVEYHTNPRLYEYVDRVKPDGAGSEDDE